MTALIVEKGLLQKDDRVVPVSAVKSTGDGEIVLGIHSSALPSFREYKEVEYRVPAEGRNNSKWQPEYTGYAMSPYEGVLGGSVLPARTYRLHDGVPFDLKVVGHGTKVRDADGGVGEVDHVLVDCVDQQITHMVVRHGLRNDYYLVPVATIVSVDDAGVVLGVSRADLRALPRYNRS